MDCMVNVLGTFNYLDACRKSNVKRFVFASSGAPLGEQEPPIHEEMVPRPISPYGASKLCGEAYCSAFHGSFGVETVCLRFGNVYGPYSTHKGSVVAKFIKQILERETLTIYGDGSQTRDFIYIDDLIRAVWAGVTVPGVGGHGIHCD
jgi:UDP-glucose 4-epimerase